tara:strand:- start:73003 stop:75327 length:2325 start_codon:yes stop_codon:yes gene_type:complete
MGRFYQTSEGKFVDNNMYQMPYELAGEVIGNAEQRVDEQVAETELLTGAVDSIQHLNFEAENTRVKGIQDKYGTQIDELTNTIMKNPLEFQKNMPALKKIQRDLMQSRDSGDIYDIEQRHGDYSKWATENKKIKEDNPDLYNQMSKHWYSDIEQRGTENANARFKGTQIVNRPDLSSKESQERFKSIKANLVESITPDGMYKVGNKSVTEERVAQIAMAELLSDPSFKGYTEQMGKTLGQEGFFDAQGNPTNIFDENGKLNSAHPFARDVASAARTYGFSENTLDEAPYQADKLKAGYNQQRDRKKAGYDIGAAKNKEGTDARLEDQKQKGRMELARLKDSTKRGQMKLAVKLEKDEAIAVGDIETLDSINVSSRPYRVATIAEQKDMGTTYMDLSAKTSAGKTLTGQEQIDLNKLDGLYGPVVEAHGDDIIRAAGEDPATYKDPARKSARVKKLLSEIFQLSDPDFGIKTTTRPYDPKRTFEPTTSQDYSERHRVQGIKDGAEKVLGNFGEMIADKMILTRSHMPAGGSSEVGKTGMKFVNTLHLSSTEPIVQDINSTAYDVQGKKRSGERVDVDTSSFATGETSSPMQSIMQATGTNSPQELAEAGYGKYTWRQERGDFIVDFIPNNAALKAQGVDVTDSYWNPDGFSLRYNNVSGDVWKNFDMSNPEVRRMRMEADVTYSEAAQVVDTNIAELKATNYENSRPFAMGGIPEALFKIDYDQESQQYIMMQSFDGDKNLNWSDIKEQGLYSFTSDPEELILLLREKVIARNKK